MNSVSRRFSAKVQDQPRFRPVYRTNSNSFITAYEPIDDTFHVAISPVARFVQFLALMPVCGVSYEHPKLLAFKWKSVRVCYTLGHITYGVFVSVFMFTFIADAGISAKNIVGFVFFSYTTICAIVFFCIAMKWPELMLVWSEKEARFTRHPYKPYGSKLSFKVRLTAVIVIVLAFTEHGLFLANSANNHYQHVVRCNYTIDDPLSYFLENQFSFIFERIPFNLPLGIFVELMNVSYTFGWNYMELFVMMLSLGIFTRFWQINRRLDLLKGKIVPEKAWIDLRNDYVILCELMEKVDHEMRYLILLSNLNNLYFICFQLLNIYDSLPYIINYVYFWFSLIYLFGRTLTAQYLAALIHEASNYPLTVLNSVPYEGWCVEVQRLIDQIRTQTMAFSGYRFFYLTRKTISAMLATIVTYELVLLQFDSAPDEQVDKSLNVDDC